MTHDKPHHNTLYYTDRLHTFVTTASSTTIARAHAMGHPGDVEAIAAPEG